MEASVRTFLQFGQANVFQLRLSSMEARPLNRLPEHVHIIMNPFSATRVTPLEVVEWALDVPFLQSVHLEDSLIESCSILDRLRQLFMVLVEDLERVHCFNTPSALVERIADNREVIRIFKLDGPVDLFFRKRVEKPTCPG